MQNAFNPKSNISEDRKRMQEIEEEIEMGICARLKLGKSLCEGNLFQRLPFLTWKLRENRLKSVKIMVSTFLPSLSFNLALGILGETAKEERGFDPRCYTRG